MTWGIRKEEGNRSHGFKGLEWKEAKGVKNVLGHKRLKRDDVDEMQGTID